MTERIDLHQLLLDDEFLKSNRKLYLDDFEDEDIWWLNDESKQMLNRGYLLRGENVLDAVHRICWAAAKKFSGTIIDVTIAYKHFVRNILLGWQSYSSPIWSNMGVSRGLPISCFGIYAGDSIESITDKLGEVINQTKLGGGTSGYFGELRGRGAPVKNNGESSGAVSFMQMFDTTMTVVSQGSCYKKGTKVLTQYGYVDFRDVIKGYHKIYQVNDKNIGSFTDDYELTHDKFTGKMFEIKGLKTESFHNLVVTSNHRMVINKLERLKENNYKGKKYWKESNSIVTAEKLKFHRDNRLPVSSYVNNDTEIGLSTIERLKIAYQADGKKSKETHKIRFHFSKERKINRLESFLNELNIPFENIERTNYGSREIIFDPCLEINKHSTLDWINLENVSLKWCIEFIDELKNWDGCHIEGKNHVSYSSINYVNIEKIQAIASICGFRVSYSKRPESDSKKILHILTIFENTIYKCGDSLTTESYEVVNEDVYCCIVPSGKIMVKYNDFVTQCGNTRRGSFAAYLDIDHPDIEEFIKIKDIGNSIQNLFYGVNIPDWWMNDMVYGKDIKKRELWTKILKSRQEKGLPYILFSDTINENKPQIYKELNEVIHASNLCFTGDTVVAIADGTNGKTIKELAELSQGKIKFPVYCATDKLQKNKIGKTNGGIINNYNWKTEIKNAVAFKTGTKKVIEITLSNGDKFKCTPDHELALKNGGYIEAQNSLNSELESFKNNQKLYVIDIQDAGEEDVYDLTVEDNHNFYIITSTEDERYENCQGILVHNCTEIALPSNVNESFVCCLSSMNLELYDEWKDSDAIYWAILFLDCVMTEFIDKTEDIKYLKQSHNFAKRHRALGLGVMGYHSYLQKNMLSFDDWETKRFNAKVFKQLYSEAKEASIELAEIFSPAPIFNELKNKKDMEDVVTVMRNTTLIAIAPTTSSSSILNQVSPGIEPYSSNYFKAGLAKGNFMRSNKYLKKLLIEKDKDNEEVWRSIMLAHGSVQHLDFLNEHEKNVFKTFKEISPAELISQAAQRQQYIDQMQSLNLLIPSQMNIKDVNKLYIQAWESKVKSLYYQRSSSVSKELMTNFVTCNACEA